MESYDNSGGINLVCESRGWNPEPEVLWLDREGATLPAEDTQTHRDTEGFSVKCHITVYDYSDSNRFYYRLQQKHHMMEAEVIINTNGYSEHFVHFVKDVRQKFPSHTIMAGNVVTGEMVEELILTGADIIKVGIGPGSVCTTRKKTGVGYPQLSAVIECADAAHGLDGHIISDGGCTCPGDVSKAFGAGADFVMLGGMLAGHSESRGETIEKKNCKKYKLFYGMSSDTAMKKHAGGVAEYRASEGKTVEVPYKGSVEVTVKDVLGGVRFTCTYVGAAKLKELSRRTTFIRVTQQLNTVFGNND
ncbi:hypothetical protein PGIGA_G00201170 [Pangasianodon gigas]|uniref:Uncharacterized protein n=1 Tax=Pangasianodon gigas TaxID=30993 RepID=A0ACC5WEV6_PANGG|nr:hypothetical protein [Pangasianodon gigas]